MEATHEQRSQPIRITAPDASRPAVTKTAGRSVATLSLGAAAQVPLEWAAGDLILGVYEVHHIHQGGGMGLVYQVFHRGWNTYMAVKSPRTEHFVTETQKQNFVRECETWADLRHHPHIVSCHYTLNLGGVPRVFAEYVEGGTLKDWIESGRLYEGGKAAALRRMLDIAIQVAWGLGYAHQQKLVHQDVKPGNVMLTPEGFAKITDFGLAKAQAAAGISWKSSGPQSILVSNGGMTPAYCSPEQADGQPLTRHTDIWSWGITVLEMFTGELTWQTGRAAPQVLKDLCQNGATNGTVPVIPDPVAALLRRCFQLSPHDRPKDFAVTAAELVRIYQSVCEAEYPQSEPQENQMDVDALNNRAVTWLEAGKTDQALALLSEILVRDRNHLEAQYNRELLLHLKGKGNLDNIKAMLRTHDEGDKADRAAALLALLEVFKGRRIDGHQWAICRPVVQLAIQMKQAHERCLNLARALVKARKWDEAVSALDNASQIAGFERAPAVTAMRQQIEQTCAQGFKSLMAQARQLNQAMKWADAEQAVRQALSIRGYRDNPEAIKLQQELGPKAFAHQLGQAKDFFTAGDWERAQRAIIRALSVPGYEQNQRALELQKAIGKGHQQAIQMPQEQERCLDLVRSLVKAGKWDEAVFVLDNASELVGYERTPVVLALRQEIVQSCAHAFKNLLDQANELIWAMKWVDAEQAVRQALIIRGHREHPEAIKLRQELEPKVFAHHLGQAKDFFSTGDWEGAQGAIKRALNVTGYEQDEGALELQEVIGNKPNAKWFLMSANEALKAGQLKVAQEAIQKARSIGGYADEEALEVAIEKNDPEALEFCKVLYTNWISQARSFLDAGNLDYANRTVMRALSCPGYENSPEALQLQQRIRQAILEQQIPLQQWIAQARFLVESQMWDHADDLIRLALQLPDCQENAETVALQHTIREAYFAYWIDQTQRLAKSAQWLEAEQALVKAEEYLKWPPLPPPEGLAEKTGRMGKCLLGFIGFKSRTKEQRLLDIGNRIRRNCFNHWFLQAEKLLAEGKTAEARCAAEAVERFISYRQPPEEGDAEAQFVSAFCYEQGWGIPRNIGQAVDWYREAAKQGHCAAQYRLGNLCFNEVAGDKTEAVAWYREASTQGNTAAQFMLGCCLENGHGSAINPSEAARWYREAAEQGYGEAQYKLGSCYERGWGIVKDKVEADKWYCKAAEQGKTEVAGWFYKAAAQGHPEAVGWLRTAAEQGNAAVQCSLGTCYQNGWGTAMNLNEAAKWFGMAAEQGHTEAVRWLRKAAEQGNSVAQCNLGVCYQNGWGVPKDVAEAVKWFLKAAELGSVVGLQRVAEAGSAEAQYQLGNRLERGRGISMDRNEAVRWYRKAAEQGNANAQYELALCYENGVGITGDKAEAAKWYRKAAAQGHRFALWWLERHNLEL